MTYDSSNKKHVKDAKKQQKILEERFKNGMEKICSNPETRYVLDAFFQEVGVFHDEPMFQTPDHVFEHGRSAGKRSAGLWWLKQALLHDPDIIGKLEADKNDPVHIYTETERTKDDE